MDSVYGALGTPNGKTDTFAMPVQRYKLSKYAVRRYAKKAYLGINLHKIFRKHNCIRKTYREAEIYIYITINTTL